MQKSIIFKKLGQLAWLSVITFVVSLIAGTTLYVFAAFTEPSVGPSSSDQDFPENILGANNAENDFNSSLVTASTTGSIIERLEYLKSNFSLNFPEQRYQAYDDWNCSNNNSTADSACGAGDAEYTGEEGVWASSTDTSLGSENVASGIVKKDTRTGLYWSDCYDSSGSQDGICDTRTNSFTIGTGCSDADINSGSCDSSKYQTKGESIDFCEALSLDADGDGTDETDWRLPTQKELMQAYINGSANNLPNPAHNYWSSTEYYSSTADVWDGYLYIGFTHYGSKTNNEYVLCVRR